MKIKKKKSVRLPNHISPINYKLTIKPDLESFTFSGNEIIKVKIDKEINKITLHSKDIDIETAQISSKQKVVSSKENINKQFTSKIIYDTESETVTLFFKNKIIGNCELHLSFVGIINDNLRGLYRSKYVLNGEEKYLATTQFEATDARRAFPCFDEPAQKATFEVSLVISKNHSAISNTLPTEIKEHEGYKVVSFSPSPRMSTYLLAFIVGEFEYIEGKTKDNVSVRVFTTKGKSHQAKFALEVAIKSLEFYNKYFNIHYPLPILDMIAIPDFESGAMENWGAVTYRETALLVDENNSSLPNKQWIALVIAHELAHQWFGNLVTMNWWTDLWLNEGFASYIEYLAIDSIFPDWNIWNQFLTSDHNVALALDGLSNSHPIEVTVHHPDEINEIFDKISYSKGASIIRMLSVYLGDEKFRQGLQHYLKKHSYKNTNTIDLWNSFEKVSNKPVVKMMSLWTKQMGYPLLTLFQTSRGWKVTQEKFFSSRIESQQYKNANTKKNLWPIPIRYESINNKTQEIEILSLLMTKKSVPLLGNSMGKINIDEESFIRVRYDEITLRNISNEIVNGSLSVKDRLGVIRDIFALVESGYIKTDVALQFTLNYKNEKEYIVWVEIANGMNKIYNLIHTETCQKKYETYARSIFTPLANCIGFEKIKSEKHTDVFLRNLAISQAGYYGDTNIINKAKKIFKERDIKKIDADIRGSIYRIVAQNGTEKEWKLFENLYKKEILHEEKERFGYALASFKDKKLLNKTLTFAMSENVKSQDTPHLIAFVWQNIQGRDLTWNFIKDNWNTILKKYGEGGHFLSRLLSPLGGHTNLKDLKDIQKFFSKNNAPGAERTLKQCYEKIASNAAWLRDDKKIIKNWLEKNY